MMFYRSITKDKSKTNNRLVILSGENCKAVGVVELPRVERERTSGSKARSAAGIWLGVWVACHSKCNIFFEKPPRF